MRVKELLSIKGIECFSNTGYDDRKTGYQVSRLYLMNADGTGRRELLPGFGRDAVLPQWTADATGLVFQSESEGVLRLYQVSLRGGVPVKLADPLGGGSSAYTGGSFSLSRTGRIALTWASATRAGDVAVDGLGSATPTQVVTALNDDVLTQRQVGAVEEIWYPSSKDGRRIQGWIIKPPGFDPAETHPPLLEIHGGPFAAYGPKFDIEKQVWAGAGYVVLYTLLIIPAAAARRFSRSPEGMAAAAALAGCAAVGLGLWSSLRWDTPAGPSVVVAAAALFGASTALPRRRTW